MLTETLVIFRVIIVLHLNYTKSCMKKLKITKKVGKQAKLKMWWKNLISIPVPDLPRCLSFQLTDSPLWAQLKIQFRIVGTWDPELPRGMSRNSWNMLARYFFSIHLPLEFLPVFSTVDTVMCLRTWCSSERQGTCSARTSNVVTQFCC